MFQFNHNSATLEAMYNKFFQSKLAQNLTLGHDETKFECFLHDQVEI